MDRETYDAHLHLAKRRRASRYAERLEMDGHQVTVEIDPRLPEGTVAFKDSKTGRVVCLYKADKAVKR